MTITEDVVTAAIDDCFQDVDQSLIDFYVKAVAETKGNIFKYVLAACVLTEQDELGRFTDGSVEGPPVSYYRAANAWAGVYVPSKRAMRKGARAVLEREGTRGRYRYSFVQPIIQPFIVIKSLSAGVLSADVLARFAITRQRSLSI